MALSEALLESLSAPEATQLRENWPLRRLLATLDAHAASASVSKLTAAALKNHVEMHGGHVLEEGGGCWAIQVAGTAGVRLMVYFRVTPGGTMALNHVKLSTIAPPAAQA
jgi:hypothetical protein